MSVPMCTFASRRAALLAAKEKKVFVIHDDRQNSTTARGQTTALKGALDAMGVTTYYRNGPIVYPTAEAVNDPEEYPCSWLGETPNDLQKSISFVRTTCEKKGPIYGIIALGKSCNIAYQIAKMHSLEVEEVDPPSDTNPYPIVAITPQSATSHYIASPAALLDLPILNALSTAISASKKLFDYKKPTVQDLRAIKQARKRALGEYSLLMEHAQQQGLPKSTIQKPDVPSLPILAKVPPSTPYPYRPAVVPPGPPKAATSNALLAPVAEPVTPCSLDSLSGMISWLERNEDIQPSQEPRIDFTKGSILGKTTAGGGTSVDLCKQVVGPNGIKPILDAVGKNQHVDRFLLGNNIVGDEGAKVIADFISDGEKSKRVYNFYIAGNAITHVGIEPIANALKNNTTVTALWLKRNDLGALGAARIADMLESNTTLQVLDLVVTNIGDSGAETIFTALARNPNSALEHLYLGSSGHGVQTAKAAAEYFKTGKSKLKSFYCAMSRLGDEGAEALAEGLKATDCLERIGLSSCLIGDRGAKALGDALEGKKKLVTLDLGWRRGTLELGEEGNMIGDEGGICLAEKLFPTVRQLDLMNNLMSDEGLKAVAEKVNDRVLSLRISPRGRRNPDVEKEVREKCKANEQRFEQEIGEEAERVREARWPKHVKEIYSIYRGNM